VLFTLNYSYDLGDIINICELWLQGNRGETVDVALSSFWGFKLIAADAQHGIDQALKGLAALLLQALKAYGNIIVDRQCGSHASHFTSRGQTAAADGGGHRHGGAFYPITDHC
jgi:hypothetical protein